MALKLKFLSRISNSITLSLSKNLITKSILMNKTPASATFTTFSNGFHKQFLTRYFSTIQSRSPEEHVSEIVHAHRIVVLMKGNPDEPRCGFSNAVCRILEMHGVLDKAKKGEDPNFFASYDVLGSDELRTAAKSYADWPTFPQVYFDGDFIGGCDILLDMHRSGKLIEELEKRGIGSALKNSATEQNS